MHSVPSRIGISHVRNLRISAPVLNIYVLYIDANFLQHNARTGDEFMRQIEPIAAYVPYMTCAGNHEAA